MKVLMDLGDLKNKEELHERLYVLLPLPEYYGRNLDALKDALTEIGVSVEISISGTGEASSEMQAYIEKFLMVLRDASLENPNLLVREEV